MPVVQATTLMLRVFLAALQPASMTEGSNGFGGFSG